MDNMGRLVDWPLMKQFPVLYNIVRRKHQIVAQVLTTSPLNVSFRRALVGDKFKDVVGSSFIGCEYRIDRRRR
jgi:hypothetical protein